jgi:hypothetical protein
MADGRCGSCSETHRWAGRPKDFLPTLNDIDGITRLERLAMTATHEAPTMLPGAVNGWTGQWKACRGCGTRSKMEIEDGYCVDCYGQEFGALGLKMAEARAKAGPESAERLAEAGRATVADPAPAAAPDDGPDVWEHPEYPACLNCRTTKRIHQGRGLCTTCRPLSLQPGYYGYIAPKKGPGGRVLPPEQAGGRLPGWATSATAAPPAPPVAARDETSVAVVEATVARHMAQLPSRPTQAAAPAPLTPAQVAEVWTGPLPDDLPDFEEFTTTGQADEDTPLMTLRKDGALTVNQAAFAALGEPERVVILVDRARRILAFRKADPGVAHARRVRGESKGNRRSVAVALALRHYGLDAASSGRYEVRRYGDALGIALRFEA